MKQSHILKKLLTASDRSFIIINRNLTITDSSIGVENFSVYPDAKIIDRDIREAFPETIGLEDIFQKIWDHQLTSFEIKGVCRDNDNYGSLYFDFYIIATNEINEADKEIIICIEDTTEIMMMSQTLLQRANEAELLSNALLQSKEYIDKIISAMADALIVTNHQGIIKTVNKAALNLFGYKHHELINKSIEILFKDTVQMEIVHCKCLGMSLHNQVTYSYKNRDNQPDFNNIEILCVSKKSEEILVSFSCATIFDYHSELDNIFDKEYSFVYIGRNITEIKLKEQALIKAKQEAEKSAQAKSYFLANMSHEIRTPMNGVLGMTELLLGTNLDQIQTEYAENIQLSGNLLLSLINRILDLSKLEQQKLELELTSFNLEECMEIITELFALQAHSKDLEINVIFAEDLPSFLIGDVVRLKQILINLVGNAIKFTNSGEILVLVERDRTFTQDSPIHLRFSVIDTGIGIPIEDQPKLFQPFSQVEASTNRRFGGTGLGLAISKQLVQLMDGEIGVSSPITDDGKGTNFWFQLPFTVDSNLNSFPNPEHKHQSDHQNDHQSQQYSTNYLVNSSAKQVEPTKLLTDKHILVIDTNTNSHLAMQYYLSKFNATVYRASNYLEAIACLDSCNSDGHPINLVLIDWQLTSFGDLNHKSSIDSHKNDSHKNLVSQIRQQVRFATLPFVIVLRSDHQQLAHQAIASGFKAHIVKPLKGQRILKAILTALDASKSSNKATHELTHTAFCKPIHVPVRESSSNIHSLSSTQNDELKNLQVLLAEDNVVNQKITLSYLSQIGCQADLAENGEQVLQLLPTKNYDIILMDCQMPLLDGYATTRAIRQAEAQSSSGNRIMIIAMTANAFKEDRDRCLESGMNDYLSKPIRKKQLQETLEYWMAQRKKLEI